MGSTGSTWSSRRPSPTTRPCSGRSAPGRDAAVSWPLFQVDAFTAEPFAGNPAAVCLLEGGEDAGWMQAVAAEMNLSETAFLRPDGTGRLRLRWFTPAVEVELCGHATLASAHVLWTEGLAGEGQALRFDTPSGMLTARPGGGRDHLARLPGDPGRGRGPAVRAAAGSGWRPGPVRRAGTVRLPGRAGRRGGRARAGPRRPAPGRPRHPRGDRDRGRRHGRRRAGAGRLRLRVPLLRPGGRDRRGPGHRVGPLHPRPVLGRAPGPRRADRLPGVAPRRPGPGPAGGRPGAARGPGRHRAPRQAHLTAGPRRLGVDSPARRTGGWATLPVGPHCRGLTE